jgi:hypothetical protein
MNGYELLGRLIWLGAKWDLRRRLPPRRSVAAGALALAGATALAVVFARRLSA